MKQEDLSSIPSARVKKPGTVPHISDPSAGKVKTEGAGEFLGLLAS